MEGQRKSVVGTAVLSIVLFLLLCLLIVLFVVYSGAYNVAATEDHTAPVRWALTTSMENSVELRAPETTPPAFDEAMTAAGAAQYKAMCQHCHGGPGAAPASWSRGMLPQPPHLHEVIGEWEPTEVFWIVKHGLKMTGMPAFGTDHDDAAIWNIAAFATQLPGMTPEEYQRLSGSSAHSHQH